MNIPASITEPEVDASVWTSGNHMWKGNIGTFIPKPTDQMILPVNNILIEASIIISVLVNVIYFVLLDRFM